MIRTGIFVYELTTVSVLAPEDPTATIRCYGQPGAPAAPGVHTLKPGIYLIVSDHSITVTGDRIDVVTERQDKAPLPVPKLQALGLGPADVASVQRFFLVAKDADADAPAAPAAPAIPAIPEDFEDDGEGGGEDDGVTS